MAIYEEVLLGRKGCRRGAATLVCPGGWSDQDLVETLDLAKQHHGPRSAFLPALQPVLFAADHFPAEANQERTIELQSLHSLTNAGKIPNNQSLNFQPHGLTIV